MRDELFQAHNVYSNCGSIFLRDEMFQAHHVFPLVDPFFFTQELFQAHQNIRNFLESISGSFSKRLNVPGAQRINFLESTK